jgi:hypothetical protein
MDTTLSTILLKASAEIRVTYAPEGTSVGVFEKKTNKMIATDSDLQMIARMNTFVNKEKQATVSEDAGKRILSMLFKLHIDQDEQKAISAGLQAVARQMDLHIKMVDYNLSVLEKSKNKETESWVFPLLKKYVTLIRNCTFYYLKAVAGGESGERKLSDFLFEKGVPQYIFKKLASEKLQGIDVGTDLSVVFFPKNPFKGFYLTLAEWRSDTIVGLAVQLTSKSAWCGRLASDDDLLRAILNLDSSVNFEDRTNKEVVALRNAHMLAVPLWDDIDSFLGTALKDQRTGDWRSTDVRDGQSGADRLVAISHSFVRFFAAKTRCADIQATFYALIFPKTYKDLKTKKFSGLYNLGHWMGETNQMEQAAHTWTEIYEQANADLLHKTANIILGDLGYPVTSDIAGSIRARVFGVERPYDKIKKIYLAIRFTSYEVEVPVKKAEKKDQTNESEPSAEKDDPFPEEPAMETVLRRCFTTPLPASQCSVPPVVFDEGFTTMVSPVTPRDEEAFESFLSKFADNKGDKIVGSARRGGANPQIPVSLKVENTLLGPLKKAGHTQLAKSIGSWLRGFSSLEFQLAVASMMAAKLSSLVDEGVLTSFVEDEEEDAPIPEELGLVGGYD